MFHRFGSPGADNRCWLGRCAVTVTRHVVYMRLKGHVPPSTRGQLYLNKDGAVSQANLTVVFPVSTVTRTIAWKEDDWIFPSSERSRGDLDHCRYLQTVTLGSPTAYSIATMYGA
jgi:hypothetical protein